MVWQTALDLVCGCKATNTANQLIEYGEYCAKPSVHVRKKPKGMELE
jgi:hypothetical protein